MRPNIYQRAIDAFYYNHGYMNFGQLKEAGVTIGQIHELEDMQAIEKISRGWYWCRDCGWEKPKDYKYIEICKVYPKAIICLDSACWLNGLISREPETVTVATGRTDRMKLDFPFDFKRYYLQNAGLDGEIQEAHTDFGSYRYYGPERTICDVIRMDMKVGSDTYLEVMDFYRGSTDQNMHDRVRYYGEALRALKNIEESIE